MEDQRNNHALMEPVHGITLQDYAAAVARIANGTPEAMVYKALGIEQPVWEEVNAIWTQRMQEDPTFAIITSYGQYFSEADRHPLLGSLQAAPAGGYLERLKTDPYFYEDLNAAREAAYAYGLDGAQWIQDHYGISLGDFQSVAMQYMEQYNAAGEQAVAEFIHYRQERKAAYAARFAQEQGGNIADDVNF